MNLLTYIIAYPFIWLISRLNFTIIYLISDFLYYVLYYVFSYRKSVVRENLKLAFPKMPKKERLKLEKNIFRNLTDVFLETFKSINVSEEELKKRFVFKYTEVLERVYNNNQNVIVMCSDYCCW